MREAFLLVIVMAASATALAQPDSRTTIYKGPVRIALPCRDQDLSLRHVTDDAAMGGRRMISYAFKNESSATCTLRGYPRFELLIKSGAVRPGGRAANSEQLPSDDEKHPPQRVIIVPGEEAGFRVHYNTGGAGYLGKPCPVSRRVRITAPGTTRHFVLREGISLCGDLQVSAIRTEAPQ